MPRYVAFLRGVMPTNAKMPALRAAFEAAGFADVKTVASSGNVVFSARAASAAALETKAEAAMMAELGRSFLTFVRPIDDLRALLATDPWATHRVPADAKRIVTFVRQRPQALRLPVTADRAAIVALDGATVFSWYQRGPATPEFMKMIERTLGKDQTTRTWDMLGKVAR